MITGAKTVIGTSQLRPSFESLRHALIAICVTGLLVAALVTLL
jgi:hypothetical protein